MATDDSVPVPDLELEKSIFFEVLDLDDHDERRQLLDRRCQGDTQLRQRIARLIAAEEESVEFLQSVADSLIVAANESASGAPSGRLPGMVEAIGSHVGVYQIEGVLGVGGFGEVYHARQETPFRRDVALKIIKLGMNTREVIRRFEMEQQALALLDHPNIAKVFDAGATGSGRPYFAMELVRGETIVNYCDEQKLGTRDRLVLFQVVCDAIQHAHQKGLIHRDIKPSNVIVNASAAVPAPKVIDFGIAKATQTDEARHTLLTQESKLLGTPVYMSPEQASLDAEDVDTRSDVYSLGALLYELLTGAPPFDARQLLSGGLLKVSDRIRETEPLKPSTRLVQRLERGTTSGGDGMRREIAKDLDWIVLKAMDKDRERRYATVSDLARDIGRYLQDEPVVAAPPSVAYRTRKFCRKYRTAVGFSVAMIGILLAAVVVTSVWAIRALRAEKKAEANHRLSEERLIDRNIGEAWRLAEAGEAYRALPLLAENISIAEVRKEPNPFHHARFSAMLANAPRLVEYWEIGDSLTAAAVSPNRRFAALGAVRGGSPKLFIVDLEEGFEVLRSIDVDQSIKILIFTLDGLSLVAADDGHDVGVYDLETGALRFTPIRHELPVAAIAMAPNGIDFASGTLNETSAEGSTIRVWRADTGRVTRIFGGKQALSHLRYSPDGANLIVGSNFDGGFVVDPMGIQPEFKIPNCWQLAHSAFSVDGTQLLLVGGFEATGAKLMEWDKGIGGELTFFGHGTYTRHGLFGPQEKTIVTGSDDRFVLLRRKEDAEEVVPRFEHRSAIDLIQFSPSGRTLLTGSSDFTIRAWNVETGEPMSPWLPHEGNVIGAFFDDGEQRIVSFCNDGRVRRWDLSVGVNLISLRQATPARAARFLPLGDRVWTSDSHGFDTIYKPGSGDVEQELRFPEGGSVDRASFLLEDGKLLATIAYDGRFFIRDLSTNETLWEATAEAVPEHELFVQDGHVVASVGPGQTLHVFDAIGRTKYEIPRHFDGVLSGVAISADARVIGLGTRSGELQVRRLREDQSVTPVFGLGGDVRLVRFEPNNRGLIATGSGRAVYRIDLNAPESVTELYRHRGKVNDLDLSSSGVLATASEDRSVRLWNLNQSASVGRPLEHDNEVTMVELSEDASLLAAACSDNSVYVWEAMGGRLMMLPLRLDAPVRDIDINPAGDKIMVLTVEGDLRIWGLPLDAWAARDAIAVASLYRNPDGFDDYFPTGFDHAKVDFQKLLESHPAAFSAGQDSYQGQTSPGGDISSSDEKSKRPVFLERAQREVRDLRDELDRGRLISGERIEEIGLLLLLASADDWPNDARLKGASYEFIKALSKNLRVSDFRWMRPFLASITPDRFLRHPYVVHPLKDETRELFRLIEREYEEGPSVLGALAALYCYHGDFAAAQWKLKQLPPSCRRLPEARLMEMLILAQNEDWAELADQALGLTLDDSTECNAALLGGRALRVLGRNAEADQLESRAFDRLKELGAGDSSDLLESLSYAVFAMTHSDWDEASRTLERVKAGMGSNGRVRALLAHCRLYSSRYEEARVLFEESLKAAPRHAGILHGLGQSNIGIGRMDHGWRQLSLAMKLDPGNETLRANLLSASLLSGRWEAARGLIGVVKDGIDAEFEDGIKLCEWLLENEAEAFLNDRRILEGGKLENPSTILSLLLSPQPLPNDWLSRIESRIVSSGVEPGEQDNSEAWRRIANAALARHRGDLALSEEILSQALMDKSFPLALRVRGELALAEICFARGELERAAEFLDRADRWLTRWQGRSGKNLGQEWFLWFQAYAKALLLGHQRAALFGSKGDSEGRGIPFDLDGCFNHDVIANSGDANQDSLDLAGGQLIANGFDGRESTNPSAIGLPLDGELFEHKLGDFSQWNAYQFGADEGENAKISPPPGKYRALRFLVCGGNGDSDLPVVLRYEDGSTERHVILCDDWFDDEVLTGEGGLTRHGVVPLIDGMGRMHLGGFQVTDDPAVFEWTITADAERNLAEIEFLASEARIGDREKGRFNLLAVSGVISD